MFNGIKNINDLMKVASDLEEGRLHNIVRKDFENLILIFIDLKNAYSGFKNSLNQQLTSINEKLNNFDYMRYDTDLQFYKEFGHAMGKIIDITSRTNLDLTNRTDNDNNVNRIENTLNEIETYFNNIKVNPEGENNEN